MPRRVAVVLLGSLVVAAAHCASFDDGAQSTTDAGLPDVPLMDAGGDEAAPTPATDGGVAVRFCADAASEFCDDFDQVGRQDVTQGWDEVDAGGLLVLSEDGGLSPPRALLLETPPINPTTELRSALTFLVRDSGVVPQSVVVAFDMEVSELGSAGPGGIFVPFRLRFEDAGTTAGFLLRGSQAGFYESFADGSASFTVDGPILKAGTWQRVRFRFERNTRNVTLTIGSSSASLTLRNATVGGGPVRVELGAARLKGDSSSWKVSFDNVTVDVAR